MTPRLTIRAVEAAERPVALRLPFRFGDATVERTAEAYARVTVSVDGRSVEGIAAQLMVPRWFDKRPALSNADTVEELRETVRAAARAAPGRSGAVADLSAALRAAGDGADRRRLPRSRRVGASRPATPSVSTRR